MPEAIPTDLIGKLFTSGWPVAAMLIAFILLDRKKFALGREVTERDTTIAKLEAQIEKLKAEGAVKETFWIKRADDGAERTQEFARALERATDAFRAAAELATRGKVSP